MRPRRRGNTEKKPTQALLCRMPGATTKTWTQTSCHLSATWFTFDSVEKQRSPPDSLPTTSRKKKSTLNLRQKQIVCFPVVVQSLKNSLRKLAKRRFVRCTARVKIFLPITSEYSVPKHRALKLFEGQKHQRESEALQPRGVLAL